MSGFDIEIDVPESKKSAVLDQVEVYEQGMEWARFGLLECPKAAVGLLWGVFKSFE